MTEIKKEKNKGGRPKGSITWKTVEKKLQDEYHREVKKNWKKLIATQITLALGEGMMQKLNGKQVMVYKLEPDKKSLEYITSQIIGRPTEKVDLEVSLPVTVNVEPYQKGDIKN